MNQRQRTIALSPTIAAKYMDTPPSPKTCPHRAHRRCAPSAAPPEGQGASRRLTVPNLPPATARQTLRGNDRRRRVCGPRCGRRRVTPGWTPSPSNTFSYYDHMLDTAVAVSVILDRFRRLGLSELDLLRDGTRCGR